MTEYLNYGLPATVGLFGHVVWIAWVLMKEQTKRPLYTRRVLWLSVTTLLLGMPLMVLQMYGWLLFVVSLSATSSLIVWFAGAFEYETSLFESELPEEARRGYYFEASPEIPRVGRVGDRRIEVYGRSERTVATLGRPSVWLKGSGFPAK